MKIRIKRKEAGVIVLYLLSVMMYLIALDVFDWSNEHSLDNLRYVMLATAIAHGYLLLYLQGRAVGLNHRTFGNSIQLIYAVAVLFFILSVIQAKKVNHPLGTRTYIQIALVLIPAMYAYCLVNLLEARTITKLFEITLILNIFFYVFIQKGIGLFLNFHNYTSISFGDSYSVFETSNNPDQFFCLFAYFNYFRKTAVNKKEKRELDFYFILSIIFVFLSFKRLAVVFVPFILILDVLIDFKMELPKYTAFLTSIFFTAATYFYTLFMQGAPFLGINVYVFSKGRDYILSLWAAKGYFSYGYGSSYELINRYLEMDLVQIYLEIGLIAVFVFSLAYFKIAGTNLLTASSIWLPMGWVLILVIIASITSKKLEKENVTISGKRRWIKKGAL